MFLEEIRAGVADLKGVGPQFRRQLEAAGLGRIADLLWHLPRSYEDRSVKISLATTRARLGNELNLGNELDVGNGGSPATATDPSYVNTIATVLRHDLAGSGPRKFLKIIVSDQSAEAALLCFNRDFLARSLPVGATIALAGKAELRFGELQLSRFEHGASTDPDFQALLPIYPLSGDLSQNHLRKFMASALDNFGIGISECLPPSLVVHYDFPSRKTAFRHIHQPPNHASLAAARRRLVYEELFFLQLQLGLTRLARQGVTGLSNNTGPINSPNTGPGNSPAAPSTTSTTVLSTSNTALGANVPGPATTPSTLPAEPALVQAFRSALNFTLTPGQERAFADLRRDIHSGTPMARLLQGDVGSGKTVVALLAALEVISLGQQAAIMVPTVLLAMQHAERAAALLAPLGVNVALLAGAMKKGVRSPLADALASGHANLVVGTHGLFSPTVSYAALGLVIIDEQHRFGVRQRQALYHKAQRPHLLTMSATPIPQTLALTLFGDMDVSVIDTLPLGRLPIETHLARLANAEKVYTWVDREIAKGHQAYFVYPLIEGDEASELKSAQSMADQLAQRYGPHNVALLHSKVDEESKKAIMQAFNAGNIKVLAATSVVEVGVDVANATCMVIEHAERFGMAALHQLRGRVGRGTHQSFCFLIYGEPLTAIGKERLLALKASTDGFVLAEKDLELRGPGDLTGLDQSGYLRLRAADLIRDAAVMVQARADVLQLLASDPSLATADNSPLRLTLALESD